jgi:hypothetical protein
MGGAYFREENISSVSEDTGQGCFYSLCTAKGIGAYNVHATQSHDTSFTTGRRKDMTLRLLFSGNKRQVSKEKQSSWKVICKRARKAAKGNKGSRVTLAKRGAG